MQSLATWGRERVRDETAKSLLRRTCFVFATDSVTVQSQASSYCRETVEKVVTPMAFLRHLAIRCNDMEKSREFYIKCIGWRFVGYRPNQPVLDLSDGTNNITLIQQPASTVRPEPEEGNEYVHFGVFVEDLQACWDRCKSWGATIAKDNIKHRNEANQEECPPDSFKVLDPDGNIVDVTANRKEWCGVTL